MKKESIKYLIWIFLTLAAMYFVIFKNGSLKLDGGFSQLAATFYAILGAFLWGVYKIFSKNRGTNYLAALLIFASILGVMYVAGYYFSPTQLVAIIALFFYSSKILKYEFKK